MRAKSLQEAVKMCGMNASIHCRIYVDEYVGVHMSNGLYNECYAGYIKRPCYECGTATEQVWVYDNEFVCGECKGRYETGNY